MMKLMGLLLVCAFLAFPIASPTAYGQEVVKLKMGDSFPIGHIAHQYALYFIKKAEDLSNQKLKIEYYPAEQLGKLKDSLNLCSQGILDIAYCPPSFYAGQIPLNTVLILPFWTTAVEGTQVYKRLVETTPELTQEFMKYKVRPLIVNSTSQYDIGTVKKPVRSPEDLKGLRLKTSGGLFDRIARQYGINTVSVASPEVYEATQRGIVEGNIFSYPSVKGYRVNELEKYHTLGARMGGFPSTYITNDRKWQTLPPEIQKALLEAAEDMSKVFAEAWDKEQIRLAEQFEKEGMAIYRIQPEERAKWEAPLKGIDTVWVQEIGKNTPAAIKVVENFRKITQEIAR